MPRVSVLLPTHNRADVLPHAIQSVLDQSEVDFELLVVADGCTDNTVALVRDIGDSRIRVFDLPKAANFGYANRNIALREARGEYIAFAAHDDLLFRDHLRLLVDQLEETGRDWTYSRPLWVSTDGIIVPFATNLTLADELQTFMTAGNTIPASCVVYRRRCLDLYGYWPEHVTHSGDWRHWVSMIEGGGRDSIAYMPTPTCLHFSANWRQSRYASFEYVNTWLEIADAAAWWPAPLRYEIPAGWPEQGVIAEAMRSGGAQWASAVRAAAECVLDRVAWDDLRVVRPQVLALQQQLHDSQVRASALEADVRLLAERIARVESKAAERERELQVRATALQVDLHATRTELAAFQNRLTETLASTSWRVTAPIRSFRRLTLARVRPPR